MRTDAELQVANIEPRKSERFDTLLQAGLRRSGSRSIPATVTDLSAAGFRAEAGQRLPIGSIVWIKLGSLAPQMARVKWSRRLTAGCRFDAPLSPYVLEQFLASVAT